MSTAYSFKTALIASALLSAALLLNGCIGMTYAKKIDSEGLVPIPGLGRGKRGYFPLQSLDYPKPAASKIGEVMKSTATPEEWAALQCFGGMALDSVKLMNSTRRCKDCFGAYILTETFRSALLHALEGASTPPQSCAAVKSLKLHVTFMYGPVNWTWRLALAFPYLGSCLMSVGLLCPAPMDVIVRINAIAQLAQGVEVQAVGFGAATRATVSDVYDSEKVAVFLAFAEALKALATDLKKQLDAQPQSRHDLFHPEA